MLCLIDYPQAHVGTMLMQVHYIDKSVYVSDGLNKINAMLDGVNQRKQMRIQDLEVRE